MRVVSAENWPTCDGVDQGVEGSRLGFAQQGFEFGEPLLDRVEIGAVGRQVEQPGARSSSIDYLRARIAFRRELMDQTGNEPSGQRDDRALWGYPARRLTGNSGITSTRGYLRGLNRSSSRKLSRISRSTFCRAIRIRSGNIEPNGSQSLQAIVVEQNVSLRDERMARATPSRAVMEFTKMPAGAAPSAAYRACMVRAPSDGENPLGSICWRLAPIRLALMAALKPAIRSDVA